MFWYCSHRCHERREFRPGNIIPDHSPLAALKGRYEKHGHEISRPLLQDRPEEAPDVVGAPRVKPAWYIFRHAVAPGPGLPVLSEEELSGVAARDAWEEIPSYAESNETEKRMIGGIVELWLFEMKWRRKAAQGQG